MGAPPLVDIERIRVSAERSALADLARGAAAFTRTCEPQDVTRARRDLLSRSLLLSETMAPDAYDAARTAMAALGLDEPIELFQSGGHGFDSARLVLYGNPTGVEFLDGYLDGLDPGGLIAVIGHEIGHRLAHHGHPTYAWARVETTRIETPVRRVYALAREFTADRFGLLACRDLHAVLRLEMRTAAGRQAKSIRFDTDAYLEQCQAVAEETMASAGIAVGFTHPEHYIRGYAEWLFSETDVYRSITGLGPGSRSLDAVDVILRRLLGRVNEPEIDRPRSTRTKPLANPPPPAWAAPVAPWRQEWVDESATDILADSARRSLAATREALATLAGAATPSIRRLADELERRAKKK